MINPGNIDLRIHPNPEKLSQAAAEVLTSLVLHVINNKGRFTLALAGGQTPRLLYHLLATTYRAVIPWRKVDIFWSDERFVPPEDPRSNYRMAKETLLDHIPIPADCVHPMPTLLPDIQEAAEAYEEMLLSHFAGQWPRFDLVLLGMGVDGHIASLFPRNIALEEEAKVVMAVRAPEADPPLRLTLTLPAINHAANVYFLIAGKEKANAIKQALTGTPKPRLSPAAGVKPLDGSLVWWIDKAAGSLL